MIFPFEWKPFDVKNGIFHLTSKIYFSKDMTPKEVQRQGIDFTDEIDMNTGWIMRFLEIDLSDKKKGFGLNFYQNHLKRFSFSLRQPTDGEDFQKTFERQNAFLKQELGEPHIIKHDIWIGYNYPWGGISSVIDIRNLSASIVMSWEKR